MKSLFDPENKFWSFIGKVTDVVCMSFLWLITSIPIFTIGASNAAYYRFTLHQVTDTEGTVWKSYFSAFKRCFKRATMLWLIELAAIVFFFVDLRAAWIFFTVTGGVPALIVLSICVCCAAIFLGCSCYFYAIVALYDFPVRKIVHDSFIMAMGNLHVTITLFVMIAAVAVGIYFFSGLFFIWIGLYIFISSYLITGVFLKYSGDVPDGKKSKKQKSKKQVKK